MDPNNFEVNLDQQPRYLHVVTSGPRTRENVRSLAQTVFQTARERKLPRVLLDVRGLTGYFGYADIFYLVKEILKDMRGKGIDQVALIDIHTTTRNDFFLEPVAHAYGLNIRVFTEEESALQWLQPS